MEILLVILVTAALFLGMILLLASKPKYASKITGTFIVLAAVGGLLIYGYGFAMTAANLPLAIIRTLLAVCGMYVGKNELGAISGTPLMSHPWMHVVFWVLHLFALYATSSAVITTVGAEALKKLRLWMARRGQLNLIYGIHDDSLDLGKQLIRRKHSVVVFVDAKPNAGQIGAISAAGCALKNDESALFADLRFLKAVGMSKNREMVLYALHPDPASNLAYARKMLRSLEEKRVAPHQTRLVILGRDEDAVRALQTQKERYGFGHVSVVEKAELVARLMIRSCPTWDTMEFDDQGRAKEDFHALVVGFGQTGQAVLKQLVMNGQFEGSNFRASVFATDCAKTDGLFSRRYAGLLENYNIDFHSQDGRSSAMYDYLDGCAQKIKYVALCAGNEKTNGELAEELADYFHDRGLTPPICQCGHSGVKRILNADRQQSFARLYDAELLSRDGLDKMAMLLNHRYQPASEKTALENWMECDYFSRQSCRASADFAGAMLKIAGVTQEEAKKNWHPGEELLLNLSKTEHHRWCAFHYCMGFHAMSDEEFDSRAAIYRQQVEETGKASIRIAKNMAGQTHACLVDWEGLKTLSQKEAEVTGKYTDYQKMDTENVLALPELLRAAGDSEV